MKLGLSFFSSSQPFIVNKINPTTEASLIRAGNNLFNAMVGMRQMYYINGLPPISKRDMTISVFLTQLSVLVGSKKKKTDADVWLFLTQHQDAVNIRSR